MFLNTKYANFGLESSVVRTSRVRLGSSCVRNDASSANSAKSSVLDYISQLASATVIYLTVFTEEINETPLPLSLSFKHINSRRNVVQGTYIHYNETNYYIKHCLFHFNI